MTHYTTNERLGHIEQMLKAVLKKIDLLILGEEIIMTELTDQLDAAEANAKANSDAEDSAMALLIKLSDMIKALGTGSTDPALVARVKALSDGLRAKADALAAAVVAGTPAADPGASMGGIV